MDPEKNRGLESKNKQPEAASMAPKEWRKDWIFRYIFRNPVTQVTITASRGVDSEAI